MANNLPRKCIFLVIMLCIFTKVYGKDYYTAAVLEHARQGIGSRESPKKIIEKNFKICERATVTAKKHGADLILLTEYAFFFPTNKEDLEHYAENIPDPNTNVNPCTTQNPKTPLLNQISCMAMQNRINVIANMGDVKDCDKEPQCPEKKKLFYNTNVVLNRQGKLLHTYRAEHLWFEPGMNEPTNKQNLTFELDVGYFATCIGFDIVFTRVSPNSVPNTVDALLFPTLGATLPPLYVSSPWWQAWAIGNNMTLLAANLQIPGQQNVGSGIYVGKRGAIANTYSPDGISKLIIAKVPKRGKSVSPDTVIYAIKKYTVERWNPENERVPAQCDIKILGKPDNVYKDYRCTSENVSDYNLVKLKEPEGQIQACNNGMCCKLEYTADLAGETFCFGVKNGTHLVGPYSWTEETCYLARSDDVDGKPCAEFLMQSSATFYKVNMTANFSTEFIYPTLDTSQVKLLPLNDWKRERKGNQASIYYKNDSGIKLLTAGIRGRPYERDPPDTEEK